MGSVVVSFWITVRIIVMLDLSRALLVRGGNLVPLGLLDLLEDQVLRGLLDLLERKAFL